MPEDEVLRSEEPEVDSQQEPIEQPDDPAIEYEMELDDGTVVACDQYGNPIEAEATSEPAADPVEEPRKVDYQSPFTTSALTDAEREKVGFSDEQMSAIEQMFERRLAQHDVARAQQSRAARELGLSDDAFAQMSPYMDQAAAMVPKELRGTKPGAAMQAFAAMALDSEASGFDIGKTLAKYVGQKAEPAKPVVREALPASARATNPRPAPSSVRPAKRPAPDTVAARAVGGNDVLDLIRRERKVYR